MPIWALSPFLKIINFNCILEHIINCETEISMARLVWQVLEKEICIRNIKIGLYKIQMEMFVCKSTREKKYRPRN